MRRVSTPSDRVVVIGAGTTPLLAELLADGYADIEAVDISSQALHELGDALGDDDARITMRTADARQVDFERLADVWHDRAVFHFFTDPTDRRRYAERAADAVRPGGHLVIGTFSPDGPEQCSGLPVARYAATTLAAEFTGFELVDSFRRLPTTPWDSTQSFTHAVLRRVG
ncbi:class I SAM-dependent methyltransferase [soil metagenome]